MHLLCNLLKFPERNKSVKFFTSDLTPPGTIPAPCPPGRPSPLQARAYPSLDRWQRADQQTPDERSAHAVRLPPRHHPEGRQGGLNILQNKEKLWLLS